VCLHVQAAALLAGSLLSAPSTTAGHSPTRTSGELLPAALLACLRVAVVTAAAEQQVYVHMPARQRTDVRVAIVLQHQGKGAASVTAAPNWYQYDRFITPPPRHYVTLAGTTTTVAPTLASSQTCGLTQATLANAHKCRSQQPAAAHPTPHARPAQCQMPHSCAGRRLQLAA
jgi:hypothetical protein